MSPPTYAVGVPGCRQDRLWASHGPNAGSNHLRPAKRDTKRSRDVGKVTPGNEIQTERSSAPGADAVRGSRPFGGPEYVLHYLARYTHRVAISNHRLLSVADGSVKFRWKDYAHGSKQRKMTNRRRRVPASLHAPCLTAPVRPDSFFRLPGEPAQETTSAPLSAVAGGHSTAARGDAWKQRDKAYPNLALPLLWWRHGGHRETHRSTDPSEIC